MYVGLVHGRLRRRDQTVVAHFPSFLELLDVEPADEPHCHQASREAWRIEQYDHVEGVAVLGAGAGNGAEVMRKLHAGRQHSADLEDSELLVVLVFVRASARRIDDHVYEAVLVSLRRQSPIRIDRVTHLCETVLVLGCMQGSCACRAWPSSMTGWPNAKKARGAGLARSGFLQCLSGLQSVARVLLEYGLEVEARRTT